MTDEYPEGWGWPMLSRKAHYFVDSRALCGHWLFFGKLNLGMDLSPDNCKDCRRRLEKRRAKQVKAASAKANP